MNKYINHPSKNVATTKVKTYKLNAIQRFAFWLRNFIENIK